MPLAKKGGEMDQLQQMLNLDEEQTALKTLATDTYESLYKINSIENLSQGHLNL